MYILLIHCTYLPPHNIFPPPGSRNPPSFSFAHFLLFHREKVSPGCGDAAPANRRTRASRTAQQHQQLNVGDAPDSDSDDDYSGISSDDNIDDDGSPLLPSVATTENQDMNARIKAAVKAKPEVTDCLSVTESRKKANRVAVKTNRKAERAYEAMVVWAWALAEKWGKKENLKKLYQEDQQGKLYREDPRITIPKIMSKTTVGNEADIPTASMAIIIGEHVKACKTHLQGRPRRGWINDILNKYRSLLNDRGIDTENITIDKFIPEAWAVCKTQLEENIKTGKSKLKKTGNQDPLECWEQIRWVFVATASATDIRTRQFRVASWIGLNTGSRPSEIAMIKIAMISFRIVDGIEWMILDFNAVDKNHRVSNSGELRWRDPVWIRSWIDPAMGDMYNEVGTVQIRNAPTLTLPFSCR